MMMACRADIYHDVTYHVIYMHIEIHYDIKEQSSENKRANLPPIFKIKKFGIFLVGGYFASFRRKGKLNKILISLSIHSSNYRIGHGT